MEGLLAQSAPPATTDVLLYRSPPAGNGTSVTTIFVCNQTAGPLTHRLRVAKVESASASSAQYIYYDTSLDANSTLKVDVGINLAPGQGIYIYGSALGLSWNIFGIER